MSDFGRVLMPRLRIVVAANVGLIALSSVVVGCRLDGQWQAVAVDPPGAKAPVEQLSFGRGGGYSATWTEEDEPRGNSGEYRWNGRQLSIAQHGFEPKKYRLKKRLDGRLVLSLGEGKSAVHVTFERIDTQEPTPSPVKPSSERQSPQPTTPPPPDPEVPPTDRP